MLQVGLVYYMIYVECVPLKSIQVIEKIRIANYFINAVQHFKFQR